MTLAEANTEHLRKHLDQLGHITILNGAMYKSHLVGYVRAINGDHFTFEDVETSERFRLPLPATFKKICKKQGAELKNE